MSVVIVIGIPFLIGLVMDQLGKKKRKARGQK